MSCTRRAPYGQKAPFSVEDVAAIRASRALAGNARDKALFELSLSSALRASDLLALCLGDVQDAGGAIRGEAITRQRKTARKAKRTPGKPIRFVISAPGQAALRAHIDANIAVLTHPHAPLFTATRLHDRRPLSVRAFREMVKVWADAAGYRDTTRFGAHSTRRSKASRIYSETKDLESVKRLLGHTNLAVTERYLGVSTQKALEVSRQYDF